ncbi:MAG TPA: peptidase M4 family protein [Cyanobacteria bacterium UBA11149]|nr:peptidase M4 family protein [Cyanobacteria bacterium UBA11367]HBE59634.1 peptidase M4 family protein [Cyanobacteria bacterium UBA11366]HBK65356.1 peptidase M4 family protein [Cyanobacteria bacterium UBA11166]HBR76674.1 peptidase M4 family protein [Cyanobacteria bacterium UBA11159]HBS70269.1 peptidase M4 family protein [Cyanobacteria bacterium UBA11153]HBW88640.1 peptidase M4 family protein [Cyanobacteria bacterium UBA11149]HCA94467.1 peptidase M4 family protein [Cyanobacteria bacterium UBA
MNRRNQKARRGRHAHKINQFCPICFVIPPHILREVAKNGASDIQEWAFQTLSLSARIRGQRDVLGKVATAMMTAGVGQKRRTIYDAKNNEDPSDLPGTLVRGEGSPAGTDIAVNEAYDGAGATYDFFKQIYDRNSIDDRGLRLDSTVHFGYQYDNAFWNGNQMVYGDGDGQIFDRFTKCIDVIGHELTHGITQYEAGLRYQGESGALNESMSDVFGSLVKQWTLKQTADKADWLVGQGLLTPNIKGIALRSMKAPGTAYNDPILGKDPQPGHTKDLYKGNQDNGGVHINSGIPNRAFYLAATAIGGYAWEKAGKIWYIALRDRLRSTSNFSRAAYHTIAIAAELYGNDSNEHRAVKEAWKQVGVEPRAIF